MPSAYANFHLTVIRKQAGYSARVTDSPVGQATTDFDLPFSREEAQRLSWRMGFSPRQIALVKSPTSDTSPTSTSPTSTSPTSFAMSLAEVGTRLFDTLFAASIGPLFFRSLDEAERNNRKLRIRLQFDEVPEVAELPWEFLYSRQLDRFLVLSTRTPLVRYIGLAQPERSLAVALPLRILAILSNPTDLPRLNVEEEWMHLSDALTDLVGRGLVVLERLEAATLASLRQALRRQQVNILHFIGHGSFAAGEATGEEAATEQEVGSLYFANDAGAHVNVSAAQVATLLHDHAPLRLVFLNACHGASSGSQDSFAGVAQKLVQQGVPAVVAMQFAISDRSAIALAREFYQSLTDGLPVESAVSEARKAIFSDNDQVGHEVEWATPVLFSRCEDGLILVVNPHNERAGEQGRGEESMDETQRDQNAKPWWQRLGEESQDLAGLGAIGATGDVVIGVVGAGASDVAIGKNITQQISKLVGAATPDDKQVIATKFAEVDAALAAQQGTMDAAKAQVAPNYLELLRGELTKTEEGTTPSASTITLVGNWLLDNVPEIAEALTSLFATPAVGRVIGKAGEAAVTWVKTRFG